MRLQGSFDLRAVVFVGFILDRLQASFDLKAVVFGAFNIYLGPRWRLGVECFDNLVVS